MRKATLSEYWRGMVGKDFELNIPYATLVEKLGEPYKSDEPDFPDDADKVKVCWGLMSGQSFIGIWDYKTYGSVEHITRFSVGVSPRGTTKEEVFKELVRYINR